MRETKNILLLFEDGDIREGSLTYASELAGRMGCSLKILMLLDAGRDDEIGHATATIRNDARSSRPGGP